MRECWLYYLPDYSFARPRGKAFQPYLVLTDRNSYPPKMLPGIDIMVCTSATNDKDARLLLSAMGVPFHGKHVN